MMCRIPTGQTASRHRSGGQTERWLTDRRLRSSLP